MPSVGGASLGFGAGGNGKKSGSFGVNSGSSNRDSAWVNDMTEITGANVDIAVAGKTSITGAMIDGDDNLHLTTNELEFKDLHDFERVGETGFGLSTSVGVSTDKGETSLHPNGETSLTLKDTGHDREQITRATIGAGVIEVGGKVADDTELSGLNRDTTKAQEITKDITTGTLDATASIDNRVFTSEGRAEIAREHKKAGSFIENVSSNLYNAMAKDTKFADAMKSIKFEETSKLAVERLLSQDGGKEAVEIISGQKQVSPEEKDLALSKFAGEFANITGVDVGDVKTMLSTEPIGGSFDKDGKDIYLNDNYVSGDVESGLGVFGHEIGHSMYGDDEVTAGYLGSRFADAYTDGLWINGEDYSLGNWNVADGNSLYVGQNSSDFANVKNRDDFILEALIIGSYYVGVSYFAGDGDIIEGNKRMKDTDAYKYTFGAVNDATGYVVGKGIEGTDYLLNKTGITDSKYYLSEQIGKGLKWYENNISEETRNYIGYVGDVTNVAIIGASAIKIVDTAVNKTLSATKSIGNKIKNGIKSNINKNALVEAKFEPKIKKQLSKRGWTEESVENCINNSVKKYSTIDNRNNPLTGIKNNAPATLYVAKDGSYVIRNDVTGDIVQISNKYDKNWKWPTNLKEKK